MRRFIKIVCLLVGLILGFGTAVAAPIVNPTSPTNTSKSADETIEGAAAEKPWAADLSYSVLTDFADELEPRLFSHTVSGAFGYEVPKLFTATISLSAFFKTLGSSISRYPEDSGLNSLELELSRLLTPEPWAILGSKNSLILSLSAGLPMAEESKIEGYQGTIELSPLLSTNFWDGRLIVNQYVNGTLIFNRNRFTPFEGDPVPTANYGYSIVPSIQIYGTLRIGVGFGMRRTRYTDGFHDFNYQNTQSISWAYKNLTAVLKHTNGGYTDDGNVQLWYVDKYRRIVSATIGYKF